MNSKQKSGSPKVKRKRKRAPSAREPKNHVPKQRKGDLFGFMAGEIEIVGDIVSPLQDWKYWRPAECLKK